LTDIDSALTSANFTTLTGMTRIGSGAGGGTRGTESPGTAGTGGTGAGNGSNNTSTGGAGTSFGSAGGGGGNNTVAGHPGGNGFKGLVIVRYAV
jgi:hypothetical protein